MHTNEPREDPLTDLGYEPRDIAMKPILKIAVGFFAFFFASALFGWVFLAGMHIGPINFEGYSSQYSGTFKESKRTMPDEKFPLLQSNLATRADIAELRKAEEVRLYGFGYANPDKSKATIPVADAMKMVEAGEGISTGNEVPAISKGNTTDQRKETAPGQTGQLDQKKATSAAPQAKTETAPKK